jgi:hypothetical protein
MTSLFQARRRAEEFAATVDGGADTRTERNEELTTLLGLVASLRDQAPVEPRAEFTSDLRGQLMLEAETALRPESAALLLPARERGRRERRLVAAASAFVLIGGTTTMAAAAQSALPGDALYPIKRGIERAEAELSMSTAGKGRDLLVQASDRLSEVEGLVDSDRIGSEPRVPETLASFSSSASEGAGLLFESFRETGDPDTIVAVRSFAAEGIATLEALAGTVPAEAQGELSDAAILLHDIDREASGLCGTCAAELPVVEVPGIFLAHAEVDRALARAAGRELDNDHPVVVRRDTVEAAGDTSTTAPAVPNAPADAPSAPGDPTPTALPSPTWDPSAWPTLLPGVGGGSAAGKKSDEQSIAEQLAEDIDAGLTGVVETLLPDPGLG